MKELVFKYDSINKSSSVIVKQRTSEIKSLMRKTAQGIVEIGHKLIEVKEELPHGKFGNWLDAEFGWSYDTARRFMNVASSFKSCNLQDLQIGTSALYMLSEPSTPEEAREEAIERAEQGESISHSTAKEITESHKENGSKKDKPEDDKMELKTYFKESKPKKNKPRMGDYQTSDKDRCPMCGQTWPEHQP